MENQLEHENTPKDTSNTEIFILANLVESPANLGAIFRLGDAFGVKKIFLSTSQVSMMESNRFKRMSRSTEKYLSFHVEEDIQSLIEHIKSMSIPLYALESTTQSKSITSTTKITKVALLMGSERNGIPSQLLDLCEASFHIPLYGHNSSINVAQATAIALYELQRKA